MERKRYNISNFLKEGKFRKVNVEAQELFCLCNGPENKKTRCHFCKNDYHQCLVGKNQQDPFQCMLCLSRHMDPLYIVRKPLIETFLKTENIFENQNAISLHFYLQIEDIKYGVQVRGLVIQKKVLSWPMIGAFYLNNQNIPTYQLKPLLINSNRKNRRQQYFYLPKQKLKIGKNTLVFKIPCLLESITSQYQSQKKGIYFMSINSVLKLSKQQLISQVTRLNRTQKSQSYQILKESLMDDGDLTVDGIKICLNCPYTGSRIRMPVRGKNCRHFSCVCLQTLIQTHQKLRLWNCPICKERLNEPKVDIWILEILHDNQNGSEAKFYTNGTYQWINQKVNNEEANQSDQQQFRRKPSLENIKQEKKQEPIHTNSKINKIIECIEIEDTQKQADIIQIDDQQPVILQKQYPKPINISDFNSKQHQEKQKRQQKHKKSVQPKNQTNQLKASLSKIQKLNELRQQLKKRQDDIKEQVRKQPLIFDLKSLQFKEMTHSQFKAKYCKMATRVKIPQDLRKIFKDIL